jgi:hypothetical protein
MKPKPVKNENSSRLTKAWILALAVATAMTVADGTNDMGAYER